MARIGLMKAVSSPTPPVSGQRMHNYGLAVDVVDEADSDDINWIRRGKIGAYCGLEHGDRAMKICPIFSIAARRPDSGPTPRRQTP